MKLVHASDKYKIEDLTKIENDLIKPFNQEPPRKICYLACNNQWNLNEIGNGTVWKMYANERKIILIININV